LLRFGGNYGNNPGSFGESENRRIKEDGEGIMDLKHAAEFSAQGPVKKDLMKTAGSNIVLVCLENGQVIPPHPEPYAVVFVVLQGEGIITSGTTEHAVRPQYLVSVKKDENRGIRCDKRMILLGIREDV
jgi:quercetin dioxygenase-like cupin family protein